MATKKYLSLERLREYDALIKAEIATKDTETLESAKSYVEEQTSSWAESLELSLMDEISNRAYRDEVDAIKNDYLKASDKTELQGNIDTVSAKVITLIGDDANKSVRTIANEELVKQLIAEGADESLNSLQEIAAWIQSHPDDAAAMNKAIEDLEAYVGTIPAGAEGNTVCNYIENVKLSHDAMWDDLYGSGKIPTLEENSHAHENIAELSLIASGDKDKWDTAAATIAEFVEVTEAEINSLFTTTT